ncbi:MAG: carbohydrate kinase family protein [Terriglobales bacterium]
MALVVGLGEVLWDLLPGGKQLGGAPANFAYISSLLGNQSAVVSRVGDDELGRELLGRLKQLKLDTSYVQVDDRHPTGTVHVKVDANGFPEFDIVQDVAWDHLEWNNALQQLAASTDVVCFGSLAQRQEPSRSTIHHFLRATRESCLRIFDVNLRQAFYNPVTLKTGFALSTVVKVNDEELPVVLQACGLPTSNDELADSELLMQHFGMELVCVTRGQKGSLLVNKDRHSEHPGFRVKVADTVGAGDAFTAALAHHYRLGYSLDVINAAANRVGSWVASHPGATPAAGPEDVARLLGAQETSAGA